MKRITLLLTVCVSLIATPSFATVMTFDGADPFSGWTVDKFRADLTYGSYNVIYENTLSPVSAANFAYVSGGGTGSISLASGGDFIFNGAYLTGWAYENDGWQYDAHSVTIDGYLNGSLVYSYTAYLTLGEMQYFAGWTNPVDMLVFTPDAERKWFLMDDFTYTAVNPVPEPSAMLLLGAGIVGLGLFRKRIRQ